LSKVQSPGCSEDFGPWTLDIGLIFQGCMINW